MDSIASSVKLDVFEYDDYRKCLRGLIEDRKAKGLPCSYRWLSSQAGYQSPNFFKLVLDGDRDLTEQGANRVVKIFKLSVKEGDYFRLLVSFKRAKSITSKLDFAEKIISIKPQTKPIYQLQKSEFSYHRQWSFVMLREVLQFSEGFRDEQEIHEKIETGLTKSEIKSSIEHLLAIGLIYRNEEGLLRVKSEWVKSPDRVINTALYGFHLDVLELAKKSLGKYSAQQRQFHGITLALNELQYEKLVRLIDEFKSNMQSALPLMSDASRVYQINVQAFPIAMRKGY